MKQITALILTTILFASCVSGEKILRTTTGVDDVRVMGELPLRIDVEKSTVKQGKLSLLVRVTIDGPDPIVKTEIYKFVGGKEELVGSTDKQGNFKIITNFSCPDTFSFVSTSYQKKYLYVGEDCRGQQYK